MRPVFAAAVAALAFAFMAPSHARVPPSPTCVPQLRDAWVRMPPGMPMGAGYFVLVNPCKAPVVVVAASSDRFADVSLHETRVDGGVSRMAPLADVRLAPGGRVVFVPGGKHLMLMEPRGAVAPGTRVRIELMLADGRRIVTDAPVRAAAP